MTHRRFGFFVSLMVRHYHLSPEQIGQLTLRQFIELSRNTLAVANFEEGKFVEAIVLGVGLVLAGEEDRRRLQDQLHTLLTGEEKKTFTLTREHLDLGAVAKALERERMAEEIVSRVRAHSEAPGRGDGELHSRGVGQSRPRRRST